MKSIAPTRQRAAVAAFARRVVGADSWIVGYPKCGNTWFNIMLRKALLLAYKLPDSTMSHVLSDWRWSRLFTGAPAIGTTHHMPLFNVESYRDMKLHLSTFRDKRVVLLIREPKDTLISLYMHKVHREEKPLYEGDVNSIVHNEIYGIEKYLKYYATWYAARSIPRALMLVRYEDLSRNTERTIRAALEFLDLPGINDSLVGEVVEYGSFENMKKLERSNALGLQTLAPPAHGRDEGFKVRKGMIGDYVNHFTEETIRYIDRRVAEELPDLYGYSLK